MEERFKTIDGLDGYVISSMGRIYSFKSNRFLKPSLMAGYRRMRMTKDGKKFTLTIHRTVAKAFIENPLYKLTVNHINGIKTDNRVSNLEWATYSENSRHAYRIGLMPRKDGKYSGSWKGGISKMKEYKQYTNKEYRRKTLETFKKYMINWRNKNRKRIKELNDKRPRKHKK